MLFSSNKNKIATHTVKAVADFSAMRPKKGKIVAESFSNLNVSNGLTNAYSFESCGQRAIQIVPFGEQMLRLTENGLQGENLSFTQFGGCTRLAYAYDNNTKTLVVSGEAGTYAITQNGATKIADQSFSSIAFCQSRLFALSGDKVYFGAPTERVFADNLYIELPTQVTALVSNGELYAIGNNVYKIEQDADETMLKVRLLASNVGKIAPNTPTAYANKVLFVANNTLYKLSSGAVVEIVTLNFTPDCATCFDGFYFVSNAQKGSLWVLDARSGKVVCAYQMDCEQIVASESLYAVSKGEILRICDTVAPSFWKSSSINFDDVATTKYLYRLTIATLYNVDVHVVADARRIYHLKGKEGLQSLLINGYGNNVKIEIYSAGKINVKQLSLTARAEVER